MKTIAKNEGLSSFVNVFLYRREAQGCPRVVVASLDTKPFLTQQTVKVTEPGGLLPVPANFKAPLAWQRLQVAEFAAMRQVWGDLYRYDQFSYTIFCHKNLFSMNVEI
ncbi:gem-associated protein 2 [Elysia marginata]|uniref:Gem-associated protein 2 n=1 Tax=Elysia marginata TaxID=1093978 RepID=A0AAV4JGS2_9GAST|nr:gem-associated protein 2 [Elysia marginata]